MLIYCPVMEERMRPDEMDERAVPGVACRTSAAPDGATRRLPSRALVVDDSLVVADVVTALLRRTGWTVDVATSVDRALEHVHGVPYDLVVCDVCMPDGGGPAVYYATIARRPNLANRFLFITGNVDDPAPWRFLAKIRAHVLEKPFTGRALRNALIKVIA
ncbi:MAG TPA: response regulator [Methylomirabilota bacterium]|nr:response regulator [Methylomirabilota bacterium]